MHLQSPYEAYRVLARSRFWHQGDPQSIVYSEILKYADEWAILAETQRERLVYFVQELDSTFREYIDEQRKRQEASDKIGKQ